MKAVLRPWPQGLSGRPSLTLCINKREESFVASCGRRSSEEIRVALEAALKARGIEIDFRTILCLGRCEEGPNIRVAPSNSWFHQVAPADVPALVDMLAEHLASRTP